MRFDTAGPWTSRLFSLRALARVGDGTFQVWAVFTSERFLTLVPSK